MDVVGMALAIWASFPGIVDMTQRASQDRNEENTGSWAPQKGCASSVATGWARDIILVFWTPDQ